MWEGYLLAFIIMVPAIALFETFSNMWSFRVLEMVLGEPGEKFTYGSYAYLYSYSTVGI